MADVNSNSLAGISLCGLPTHLLCHVRYCHMLWMRVACVVSAYAPAMRCPAQYIMCGTDIGYGATAAYASAINKCIISQVSGPSSLPI
eukprot:564291-Rhodomonas_salina.5